MPAPIAANLRACLDGSAVRTALVAWPRCCAPSWPRWDRQTDGRIEVSLNAPYGGGRNKSTPRLSAELRTSFGLHCDKVDALINWTAHNTGDGRRTGLPHKNIPITHKFRSPALSVISNFHFEFAYLFTVFQTLSLHSCAHAHALSLCNVENRPLNGCSSTSSSTFYLKNIFTF